ncbi:MAG: hypothetical protein GXY33_11165 [Phycisphaerae bacterium]|nr:hypothetical protein [Phycisphaerae bacterium]
MTRELIIGNDRLLAQFDQAYRLTDLYFPRDHRANLVASRPGRMGVADGQRLIWTDDPSWRLKIRPVHETLASSVSLSNPLLQAVCYCTEAADIERPLIVRQVRVRNLVDYPRKLCVVHHVELSHDASDAGGFSFQGGLGGLVHPTGEHLVFIGFLTDNPGDQVSVAVKEGLVRFLDAHGGGEDSEGRPTEGLIKVDLELDGFEERSVWMVLMGAGHDEELAALAADLIETGPQTVLDRSCAYWRFWVTGANINFGNLPGPVIDLFKRSLLTLRGSMPEVTAGGASDDGLDLVPTTLIAHAFDRAGLPEASRRLYRRIRSSIRARLRADRNEDEAIQPVHPAALGTVLWSLWRHYFRFRDIEQIRRFWTDLIGPAAEAICQTYDEHLQLPTAGADLWRRGSGVDAFTVGAAFGGLAAARNFAVCFGDRERAERYAVAADRIKLGAERKLYDERARRFGSVLWLTSAGHGKLDSRLDATMLGLARFGMFEPDDERMAATVTAICEKLWVNTPVGGLARFAKDVEGIASAELAVGIPGRPSTTATMWLAQYLIGRASNLGELKQALPLLEWAVSAASPTGLLAERLDPNSKDRTDQPDLWAHAEFAAAVVDYLEKLERLQICRNCGQSMYRMRRHWPMQIKVQDLLERYAEDPQAEPRKPDRLVVFNREGREVTLSIDPRECIGCGVCCIQCGREVLVMTDDKAAVDPQRLAECRVCRECEKVCPTDAIRINVEPEPSEAG